MPGHTDPSLNRIRLNDVEIAYWERGTAARASPTLLFVHATGFHGRVFDRILESFPDYHSIAYEQRGHGRSEFATIEHWRQVGEDLVAFVEALDLREVIGIGHSMGGHALVEAAAKTSRFDRLLLLDPTIAAPDAYSDELPQFEGGVHPAAKRKNHFASAEEMIERLLPKGGYALFEPRILDDYCRYGIGESADGGYELLCHPRTEASVYMTSRTNGAVYDSVRSLTIPVTIIRAMEPGANRDIGDFLVSPTWPGLADEFPQAQDIHLPDCSHFIPMQMPDKVVAALEAEIEHWQSSELATA